ncbi:hypothetical protein H8E77_28450 [bacterium]|nr:hypothetical protein [bacterium]
MDERTENASQHEANNLWKVNQQRISTQQCRIAIIHPDSIRGGQKCETSRLLSTPIFLLSTTFLATACEKRYKEQLI